MNSTHALDSTQQPRGSANHLQQTGIAQQPVQVMILTMTAEKRLVAEAFRSGASAYVLKSFAAADLLKAIGVSLPDPLVEQKAVSLSKQLTPRQVEIIQLLAEGRAQKEVADILRISVRTVADHKYRIMAQLGLKTNAELLQYAAKRGIVAIERSDAIKASRLYGLPCAKCGAYYFSDEPNCPICEGRRVNSRPPGLM